MTKRDKRLASSIDSLKEEIERHFKKIDADIDNDDEILAKYHVKEIDKSLIFALEHKIMLFGADKKSDELVKEYKLRLEKYRKRLGVKD